MREAGFLFYILFPQKQMRESGFFFLFPQKQTRHVYTLKQCSMGGVQNVRPLMIFRPKQEPCWTLNQAVFLKKKALHNFTTEDAIIKMRSFYTCNKPHKKSIPSAYLIFRRSGKCMRNIKYWTKRNNKFF